MVACPDCRRKFATVQSLNQHLESSSRHASCLECQRGFDTVRQFKYHFYTSHASTDAFSALVVDLSAALPGTATSSPGLTATPSDQAYCGIPGTLIEPVFRMACKLRSRNPTPEAIAAKTGTVLDLEIVSAITEGALRTLPPDNSPHGIECRREKAAEKLRKAEEAESNFVLRLRSVDKDLLRESQLKERIRIALDSGLEDVVRLTPDALLSAPTMICGKSCTWVEYKNTFGFRSNPFVASKNKQQFQRYASQFGPGMVVYKLGYETDHVQIEDVHCFREAEVTRWIESHRTT